MLSENSAHEILQRLFQRHRIVELEPLFDALGTRSRMTVFRRLREMGYLTSYTHGGRYYTLRDIPQFGEHGLWFHQGIGFSRAGTMKQTLAEDVHAADAGRTHPELELLLRVRVHNTLLALVREGRIGREIFRHLHLYVSAEAERASQQLAQRERLVTAAVEALVPLSDEATIELLVELLHAADGLIAPSEVAARLAARGLQVTAEQVEEVYARYRLRPQKKTPGQALPSSRR